MDHAVAPVQAYVRVNGYFTVSEYPIIESIRHGYRTATDLYGLTMPKTSSRAITSPVGTADAMETIAPVTLDLPAMRRVVEREGGCIVWGGAVHLSPADDIIIRVERPLDIDSEGQLVASVLSKKLAAGSTHVVIDNRQLARVAKLSGAPAAREAGLELHTPLGARVEAGQPLYTVHAAAQWELAYALACAEDNTDIVAIAEDSLTTDLPP